ncbi:MAG: TonB-dependent receptor [Deltaproteobacteria bacterium]|nr:TonB-dependent receptor [Deltaproteobacteria bacterium]
MTKGKLLLLTIFIFFISAIVLANEDTNDEDLFYLEEIVVTATKTGDKIKDIPASISVIEGSDIIDSGNRVIQDALHLVPGISVNDVSGNGIQTMMTMRGMPNSNSQYILVLVDGVPQNTPTDIVRWGNIPMDNVERVEVIKGPAAALYGMNAIGGVINIITKKPNALGEGKISAGFGSYDENKQKVSFSGVAAKFGYSMGGARHQSDGWRDDNNSYEKYNLYGKVTRDINSKHSISLNLAFSEWDNDFPESIRYSDYNAGNFDSGIYGHGKEKNTQADNALIYEYRLNEQQKITNRLYGQWVDTKWKDIVDVVDEDVESLRIGNELQYETLHDFIGRKNRIIMGYQYEHQDAEAERRFSSYFPVPSRVGQKYVANDSVRKVNGLYLHDMFYINDSLILSAGARYDYTDFEFDNYLDPELSGSDSMDKISPKMGLTYNLNANLSLFTNIGTGFKTPTGAQVARYIGLEPEKNISYETGLKGTISQILYFTASVYRNDLKDQISSVADPREPSGYSLTNAGKSKTEGFEFEINLINQENFQAFVSYNYNRSEFIEFFDQDLELDYAGNDFAWQPRHKITGGISYRHPSGIIASLTTKWIDEQYLSNANEYTQDSYSITDLSISYTRNSWEVSMDVRNLFDKKYATYGEDWGWGDVFLTEGDPITVFGELTYNF